jgi:hypothetical protein
VAPVALSPVRPSADAHEAQQGFAELGWRLRRSAGRAVSATSWVDATDVTLKRTITPTAVHMGRDAGLVRCWMGTSPELKAATGSRSRVGIAQDAQYGRSAAGAAASPRFSAR